MANEWSEQTRQLVTTSTSARSSSARVLLTTVFGDALLPRRQSAPVQALARLVEPLGVNERLVRTSLQRLATEELVESERVGRRSFYRVHPHATATFEQAEQRIYHRRRVEWDGRWTVAVVDQVAGDADDVARLGRELQWLGMATLSTGVHVSATLLPEEITTAVHHAGVPLAALVRGPLASGSITDDPYLGALADPQGELRDLHKMHLDRFGDLVDSAGAAGPDEAFTIRTLLVDGWRRIALRAVDLPDELLPSNWPGDEAYELTAELYRALAESSETHLDRAIGPTATPRPDRFPVPAA